MPKNPNPPPAREVRTFVNPIAIRYDTPDGHTFHYYREWHHLELRLEEYRIGRIMSSMERDWDSGGFGTEEDALLQAAYSDYASMPAADKEKLQDIQRRQMIPARNGAVRRLQGWGVIVNKRRVTAFEAGKDGADQGDFEETFNRIHVNIRAFGSDDRLGSLFLSQPDNRYPGSGDPDGNYLSADVVVRSEVLEELETAIRETGTTPSLTAHVDVALFQTEVERSLAEPWHPQDYAMLKDSYAPLSLAHLIWETADRKMVTSDRDGDFEDEIRPAVQASVSPAATEGSAVAKRIRSLAMAVWGLAAAVVIAAVLR